MIRAVDRDAAQVDRVGGDRRRLLFSRDRSEIGRHEFRGAHRRPRLVFGVQDGLGFVPGFRQGNDAVVPERDVRVGFLHHERLASLSYPHTEARQVLIPAEIGVARRQVTDRQFVQRTSHRFALFLHVARPFCPVPRRSTEIGVPVKYVKRSMSKVP